MLDDYALKKVLDDNSEVIDSSDFDTLLSNLQRRYEPEEVGQISQLLYESDIPYLEGMDYVPTCAFFKSEFTTLEIPNCITKINKFAFAFSKIGVLTIPASVTEVDEYAFYGAKIDEVDYKGTKDQLFELGAELPRDSVVSIG